MLRSMMQWRSLIALTAVALLTASVAEAQEKKQQQPRRQRGGSGGRAFNFGGRGGGGAGALQLIGREEVRKELKITEEQSGIIRELQQSARPDFRALLGNIRDLSREEREKKLAELRKQSEKKAKDAEADLYGLILDEPQSKRLKQIVLQQKGNRALTEPETAKALGLTPAQTAKIKAAMENAQKKQRELFSGVGGIFGGGRRPGGNKDNKNTERKRPSREELQKRFAEMRAKGEALRAETDKAIASVLTAEQKTKFAALKGAKFELPRRSFSRNRGGRGGQGQRGQGGRERRPQRPSNKKREA